MAGRKDQTDTAPAGPRRSRRMLLAGGTGALVVLAADALARPAPATAANGGNVILGQDNHRDRHHAHHQFHQQR